MTRNANGAGGSPTSDAVTSRYDCAPYASTGQGTADHRHEHAVGDRVRVERDETRYRPAGTWKHYWGCVATVAEINLDQKRPKLTEYGVIFGAVRLDARDGTIVGARSWFRPHELTPLGRPLSASLSAARRAS